MAPPRSSSCTVISVTRSARGQVGGRLLFATGNAGKLAEVRQILTPLGFEVVAPADVGGLTEVEETGETFADNALLKARAAAAAAGMPAMADDSGLCVDVLDGAPGVRSARYAGPDASDANRVAKLLEVMAGATDRSARFVCAVAVARPDGHADTVEGECTGTILDAPRGNGGFGYDPVFVPDGESLTFAELPAEAKNRISHRGRALAGLPGLVRRVLG